MEKPLSVRTRSALLVMLAVAGLLVGCGGDDPQSTDPETTEPETTEPESTEPVGIVEVFNGFEYYGACGNESVQAGDTIYYPLFADEQAALDTNRYPTDLSEQGMAPLQRVAEPGPGDDIGTLLVYEDGTARFESDSGRVLWLSARERSYNWEC